MNWDFLNVSFLRPDGLGVALNNFDSLDFISKMGGMNRIVKKIVSTMVIVGCITSQIGCASKATKIIAPLSEIKFEKDYQYTVRLKTGEQTKTVTGDQIQNKSDKIIIDSIKPMIIQEIQSIDGQSSIRNGSYALRGMGIGALIGGGSFFVLGMAAAKSFSDESKSEGSDGASAGQIIRVGVLAGIIGVASGGTVGLIVGALVPKYNKVQITPIISPTTSGMDTGVDVGFKF